MVYDSIRNKFLCKIQGHNPFTTTLQWTIGGEVLQIKDQLPYLGAVFDSRNGQSHCEARTRSAQKSFYSLQGVGVCQNSLESHIALSIFRTAVKPALIYGCQSIYISETQLNKLNVCESKLIKSILGLKYQTHSNPLLQALLNNSYRNSVKRRLAQPVAPGVNGVVDSVRLLLSEYNNSYCGILTNMLSAI